MKRALWENEGFIAIEEFTSMDQLKKFWFSPDYREAITLREGRVKLDIVVAISSQKQEAKR